MPLSCAQQTFFDSYIERPLIHLALQACQCNWRDFFEWRRDCHEFQEAFIDAEKRAITIFEDKARELALDKSERLLIMLLKALRPELYEENTPPDLSTLSNAQVFEILGLHPGRG